eukprot:scaffold7697_cov76-Cyclotella_meneghiniana.AAC.3
MSLMSCLFDVPDVRQGDCARSKEQGASSVCFFFLANYLPPYQLDISTYLSHRERGERVLKK